MDLADRVLLDDESRTATSRASRIARDLQEAILTGALADGDKLPAERQLADQYGASRATVRGALDQLEHAHLVSRRIGSGTFVTHRHSTDHETVADTTSPLELIEVRLALEPHMIELAVVSASARDLEELNAAHDRVAAAGDDPEQFSEADAHFHLTVARCTGNPLMESVYEQINHVRSRVHWNAMKDKILTADRMAAYNAQHAALNHALRSRDVNGAVGVITEHLQSAKRDLLGAQLERRPTIEREEPTSETT